MEMCLSCNFVGIVVGDEWSIFYNREAGGSFCATEWFSRHRFGGKPLRHLLICLRI